MKIATKYDPSQVEDKWYKYWMDNKLFRSVPDDREPYTIVIPPPNVTGVLHMGHMMNNTIQDILVRRARMQGKNACWVPGTDHASIATEAKVVGRLAQQGIKKTDLTRPEFLKHAWDWTHEHGGIILEQLKKLGASCDWDRTCFTMDDKRSEGVLKVFCDLYEKGLIYRGVRMVNWDPKAQTALSDEEVVFKECKSKLYYLKYKIEGEDGYAIVATTRPETILGDSAMCINPKDPKNQHLKGKKVIVPLINRVIPVIEDEYVDIEFGTGCLKVTPAHDVNDYMLGEKYNLETIDIFNEDGTLNENGQMYSGMDRFDVRVKIEKDLTEAGLMEKVEDYNNSVGYSERTNVPIEPKLSMQWFMKMENLGKPALDVVMNDDVKLVPAKFKNTYKHWMENVRDWCISRQLWWGQRIPAYFLPEGGFVVADSPEKALVLANEKLAKQGKDAIKLKDMRQDEDSLDTWFSSWLWPISVFDGINNPENEEINYYYPTNDLVTGPDILFFWVARMIMAGLEFKKEIPFKNVYLTGIVRDSQGRKMSKSLGNSPDPLELITKFGADGVRMGMMLAAPAGNDILFDEGLCEQGRNFCNKIWNAYRLVKGWEVDDKLSQPVYADLAYNSFSAQMQKTINEVDDLFSKFRISEALMAVYKLFRDDYSSWYLEIIKPAYQSPIDSKTLSQALGFFEQLMLIIHPFMPFISEELWQNIKERKDGESIMTVQQTKCADFDSELLKKYENAKSVISSIRSIRLDKNIPNKEDLVLVVPALRDNGFDSVIIKMANLSEIKPAQCDSKIEKETGDDVSVSFMVDVDEYSVPLGKFVNVEDEIVKMEKEIKYLEGFLKAVIKKLSNERFVNNAKPAIVENERNKKVDAENKINTLIESITKLRGK